MYSSYSQMFLKKKHSQFPPETTETTEVDERDFCVAFVRCPEIFAPHTISFLQPKFARKVVRRAPHEMPDKSISEKFTNRARLKQPQAGVRSFFSLVLGKLSLHFLVHKCGESATFSHRSSTSRIWRHAMFRRFLSISGIS